MTHTPLDAATLEAAIQYANNQPKRQSRVVVLTERDSTQRHFINGVIWRDTHPKDHEATLSSEQAPKLNIRCETTVTPIGGAMTYLNVVRVEQEDDGSWTAVTDHWPMPEIASQEATHDHNPTPHGQVGSDNKSLRDKAGDVLIVMCPICRKIYNSSDCPHTYDDVVGVLEARGKQFKKGVARIKE